MSTDFLDRINGLIPPRTKANDFIHIIRDIRGDATDMIAAAQDPECIYGDMVIKYNDFITKYSIILPQLDILLPEIDAIVAVGNNITDVGVVADNIVGLGVITDNIEEVLLAATNAEIATVSAANAELDMWTAEAAKRTADSYATQPVDEFVIVTTSNGDGTYTEAVTTEYSSLHYARFAGGNGSFLYITEPFIATEAQTNFVTSNTMVFDTIDVIVRGLRLQKTLDYAYVNDTEIEITGIPLVAGDNVVINIYRVTELSSLPLATATSVGGVKLSYDPGNGSLYITTNGDDALWE